MLYFMGGFPLLIVGFILGDISTIVGLLGIFGAGLYGSVIAVLVKNKRYDKKPAWLAVPGSMIAYFIGFMGAIYG